MILNVEKRGVSSQLAKVTKYEELASVKIIVDIWRHATDHSDLSLRTCSFMFENIFEQNSYSNNSNTIVLFWVRRFKHAFVDAEMSRWNFDLQSGVINVRRWPKANMQNQSASVNETGTTRSSTSLYLFHVRSYWQNSTRAYMASMTFSKGHWSDLHADHNQRQRYDHTSVCDENRWDCGVPL